MNISVRYVPDLRRTIRVNLYLRRKAMWIFIGGGALLIVLAVVMGVGTSAFATFSLVLGV